MNCKIFNLVLLYIILTIIEISYADDLLDDNDEPPEGYYAFVESPSAIPPKVRPPPYTHVDIDCKEMTSKASYVSVHNICGDLNKGQIPRNPMQQNVLGEPYPFELLRNQTLKFLSKTLPVLKSDDTLPKVTQILPDEPIENFDNNNGIGRRMGKSLKAAASVDDNNNTNNSNNEHHEESRGRKFCDGGGVFCTLYQAIQGEPMARTKPHQIVAERREEAVPVQQAPSQPRYEGPPTPCPAKVEYATPVFAKNYQGSWRYVVQIPYEGYFTQTVEVTRCLQARCHYLDGGCLSSPRWVSMLVAEIFYPNSEEQSSTQPSSTSQQQQQSLANGAPPIQDFQAYQQYLQRRAGEVSSSSSSASSDINNNQQQQQQQKLPHCDGHDEIGCFQVRLYYDWFLIPGSCKCWRPDYFSRYVRRKPNQSVAGDL